MMTLSRTASSRGSLDEHASGYQMSLTGSSSEVLQEDERDQHYNTVSGVPCYPSPGIGARRRNLGHVSTSHKLFFVKKYTEDIHLEMSQICVYSQEFCSSLIE